MILGQPVIIFVNCSVLVIVNNVLPSVGDSTRVCFFEGFCVARKLRNILTFLLVIVVIYIIETCFMLLLAWIQPKLFCIVESIFLFRTIHT